MKSESARRSAPVHGAFWAACCRAFSCTFRFGIAIGVAVAGLFDHVLEGLAGRVVAAAFVLPAVAAFMLVTSPIAAIRPASWAPRISPTEALRADDEKRRTGISNNFLPKTLF